MKVNEDKINWLTKTLKTITENLNNVVDIENITDGEFTYDGIMKHIKMIEEDK